MSRVVGKDDVGESENGLRELSATRHGGSIVTNVLAKQK